MPGIHDVHIRKFQAACDAKDPQTAAKVLKDAFEDPEMNEIRLGLLCTAVFDRRFQYAFIGALQTFSRRFPNSLYPVQAFAAVILAMQDHPEEASEEARFYLRKARDGSLLDKTDRSLVLEAGLASAFIALTAVYTACGARDYAKRVLAMGLDYVQNQRQQALLRAELGRIEKEVAAPGNAEINRRWERFETGDDAAGVIALANERKFELFARRLDLLDAGMRLGEKRAFEQEVLLVPILGEKDGQQYAVLR